MTWHTTIYRIPGLHERRCGMPGCGSAALFRAIASDGKGLRDCDLCEPCAEIVATKAGLPLPAKPAQAWPVPDQARVAACGSCGAAIVWARTDAGRPMPVHPDDGVSHFVACPFASQHRKRQK